MYLKTENVQALVNGFDLNSYQRSLAKKELERLITLLKDMEKQLTLTDVSNQREQFNAFYDFSSELPLCVEDYDNDELYKKFKESII